MFRINPRVYEVSKVSTVCKWEAGEGSCSLHSTGDSHTYVCVFMYLMQGCQSILVDQVWADSSVEQLPH